ncbi:DNA sulfur modification protein DndD [Paracoccaceae bacterium]|nr:DNA sulfur modification protein DndD [Paracoccaceae bacterium]
MKLNFLSIYNIGPFTGNHTFDFSASSKDCPIILIGALNGSGKTTVLEAIQIALYGPFSQPVKDSTKGYLKYIKTMLNRDAKDNHASITIGLNITEGDENNSYTIMREWDFSKLPYKEKFKIIKNNKENKTLAEENWTKKIMSIFPPDLAALFFFDGEKIEEMADLDKMPKIIEAALHSLFGLENLKKLEKDLDNIKLNNLKQSLNKSDNSVINEQKNILLALDKELATKNAKLIQQRDKVAMIDDQIKAKSEKFSLEGGSQFEMFEKDNKKLTECISEQKRLEGKLMYLVETALPISIIESSHFEKLKFDLASRTTYQNKLQEVKSFRTRDKKTLTLLNELSVSTAIISKLSSKLERDYVLNEDQKEPEELFFDSDKGYLERLEKDMLSAKAEAEELISKIEKLKKEIKELNEKIALLPDKDSISRLKLEIQISQKSKEDENSVLEKYEEEIRSLNFKLNSAKNIISGVLEQKIENKKNLMENERIAKFAIEYQRLVIEFKEKIIEKNIEKIGALATECFSLISRKKELINCISVNKEDFTISLKNLDEQTVLVEHLSAGERQLLATSLLWGFAKAAGAEFPTVIDTPLGRLDSRNRTNLVENYFPKASHQVILLSTDEEINQKYYPRMEKYISDEYTIQFSSQIKSSKILKGYQFYEKIPIKELSA